MKKTLQLLLALMVTATLSAQDFNDGVYNYTITDATNNYCEVHSMVNPGSLTTLTIPSNVMMNGFVPFTVTAIGDSAFNQVTGFTEVILPSTVTELKRRAFRQSSLEKINCENVVSTAAAFESCKSLTDIGTYDNLEVIGDFTFYECSALDVVIPAATTTLGKAAFANDDGIVQFEIPSTVTTIGEYLLGKCFNLQDVQLNWAVPADVPVGSKNFFREMDKTLINIYVPVGTEELYEAHELWGLFPAANIIEGTMPILSTNKFEKALGLSLYPNPTNDIVNIKSKNITNLDITVYDINGRSLLNTSNSRIDISSFASGLYVFKVKTDEGQLVKRILKN